MAKEDNLRDLWKNRLTGQMPAGLAAEIDEFETEIFLKKQGKIDDKVFAETRLRRGAYGQRYDNGFRYDGSTMREIPYPDRTLTKGPSTLWDAPGMVRIKIPYGGVTVEQMKVMADLAEEYSDSVCHVTTRQDIQLHFVHIEDTPDLFRRLAAVGITTREACGNSIRNVTACPMAGVCNDAAFDVTPYADAMFRFLLGHPDVQDFGRKFKIAFSGCHDKPCGLAKLHDMGLIAVTKEEAGQTKRGFKVYVGGGLGAIPFQAELFDAFVPEEEILPLSQAISRVFARLGEKKNRNRARIKFLISSLGIDEFRRLVLEERAKLPEDPRFTAYLQSLDSFIETPLHPVEAKAEKITDADPLYPLWLARNTEHQRHPGYVVVKIALPLGDLSAKQLRDLSKLCETYVGDSVRFSVDQNILLRFVREVDLPAIYRALKAIGLASPFAETIADLTACPGTDTCKLGVSSSRGLAAELREHFVSKDPAWHAALKDVRIKMSGCFNSCGQHHIADIGFYGVSRKVGNYMVPHFQLVLGGQRTENAGAYGLAVTSIPSKAVPKAVERLIDLYLQKKSDGESFQALIKRLGKGEVKTLLDDLTEVPPYSVDPSYYTDWGDVREYSKRDIGIGECAGEVVSLADFGLKTADREMFESQLAFEAGDLPKAARLSFQAMIHAAQGLVKLKNPDISENPDQVAEAFRVHFCDTKLFHDPYAGDRFANFFFRAVEEKTPAADLAHVRKWLEEAQLFIDAAHGANARLPAG